jgi:hypothetical protein
MPTRDLVDALISGDSIAIENTFNAAMSDKVSAALDSYRVQIATKMFVPREESIEQETDVNTDAA